MGLVKPEQAAISQVRDVWGARSKSRPTLIDVASGDNRAVSVAVSNTAIGVPMVAGVLVGLIGGRFGAAAVRLLCGLLSLLAAVLIMKMADVSEPF